MSASDIRGVDWKLDLMAELGKPGAPRVLTTAELQVVADRFKPGISYPTARSSGDVMARAGALRKVGNGLYLNRRCLPPAELVEAAQHIRQGAHISLHSGLGGAHNNPSRVVHAVLPSTPEKRPSVGTVKTVEGDEFQFHSLPAKYFPHSDEERRLLLSRAARCPTFTPEASFLHWLRLSSDGRSTLQRPPHGDIEFADESNPADFGLRLSVLKKAAQHYDLVKLLEPWLAEWRRVHADETELVDQETMKSAEPARRSRLRR